MSWRALLMAASCWICLIMADLGSEELLIAATSMVEKGNVAGEIAGTP